MKTRPILALALTTALGATALVVVNADAQQPPAPPPAATTGDQPPPPPPGGPGPRDFVPGRGMDRHGLRETGRDRDGPEHDTGHDTGHDLGRMERLSPNDRAAFLDARIAAVRAGLQLTPDQEKLWGPLESAVRDGIKRGQDMRRDVEAKGRPTDPVDGLSRMADAAATRGDAMRKIADAARPLYASLNDEQRRRLGMLMHRGGGHDGWRERMGERMRGWREWGAEHLGFGRQGALQPTRPDLFQHTLDAFGGDPSDGALNERRL